MSWWYIVLAVLTTLAGAAVVVIRERRKGRKWAGVLMSAAEYTMGRFAQAGLPSKADELARNLGDAIKDAGPGIQAANDKLHAEVKKTVAARLGASTRSLINEALRKKREID